MRDQELMNAIDALRLDQLFNGHALILAKPHKKELHTLWFTIKVNATYTVVKTMIIIN